MRKSLALFVAVFVCLGALFAPAMGASLLSGPERSPSGSTELSGKKSQKKTCKKLKKKIKKAKSKKAKKKAKKKYNKKCKCKKLKKKSKKAKSPAKRKKAKAKHTKLCTAGGGSGGGGTGGGGTGGGGTGGGGTTTKTSRVVEGTYANPAAGIVGVGSDCTAGGCVEIATTAGENYISVEITDASGQPVAAALAQDTDGDGVGTFFATVCGASTAPIPITAGSPVTVIIGAGVVVDGATIPPGACPSVATSGTVKATLSNRA
jgi:hypothetical protein